MFERSNKFTFYLTDYLSTEDMVKAFIDKLFTNTITIEEDGTEVVRYKYDGYLIFAHNFSRFDSIFIFKLLVKYVFENGYTIEVLKGDSDFINISIKSTTHKFEINFRYYHKRFKFSNNNTFLLSGHPVSRPATPLPHYEDYSNGWKLNI